MLLGDARGECDLVFGFSIFQFSATQDGSGLGHDAAGFWLALCLGPRGGYMCLESSK